MADEAIIGAITAPSCVKCGAPACWATSGDPSSFRCSACDLAEEPMRGQPEITPPETHVAYIAKLEAELADMEASAAIGDKDYLAMVDRADAAMKRIAELELQLAAARAERDSMRFTDEKLEAALANAQQTIAAKDEIIRRLADERAALKYLVDEVRSPDADADHDARYVEMGDEFRFPAVAVKEGGWERATWADWSDDEESV